MPGDHFAPVPLFALSDQRLTVRDLKVLGVLAYFFRLGKTTVAGPSRVQIKELTGISFQRISESTARLEQFGYINKTVNRGRSKSNSYALLKGNRNQDVLPGQKREQIPGQKREQIPGHPKRYEINTTNQPLNKTENQEMNKTYNRNNQTNNERRKDETRKRVPTAAEQTEGIFGTLKRESLKEKALKRESQ